MKLEVEEGCDDFALKRQLTAAERRADFKFDINNMIGCWKSWQNLVGLTESVNAHSQGWVTPSILTAKSVFV